MCYVASLMSFSLNDSFQVGPARLRTSHHRPQLHQHPYPLHSPQPPNTRWLTPAERRLAQVRLAEDAAEADEDRAEDTCVTALLHISACC